MELEGTIWTGTPVYESRGVVVRIHWTPNSRQTPLSGLLGLLLFPLTVLFGVIVFLVTLPVIVVLFFWSRHKLKRFMKGMQQEAGKPKDSRYVDSYVVESVDTPEDSERLLSDGNSEGTADRN
jgi:hypothetical protein